MFKFDLLPNEKVLAIYRQAEVVLLKPLAIIFALIYFPWFFLLKYDLAAQFARWLFLWTLLVLAYAVNKYLLWLLNVYLISSKRLVKIAYKNLLNKKVLESPLDHILNVGFSTKGFWQTLFGFGSVEVQAAGLPEAMVLQNLSHPSQIKDFIWAAHHNHSHSAVLEPQTISHKPQQTAQAHLPQQQTAKPKTQSGPRLKF